MRYCNLFTRPGSLRLCICLLFLLLPASLFAADAQTPFAITGAGVEQSEDGPFVPTEFTFLPGDYVHFAFEVSGFKTVGGDYATSRQIALTYRVALIDPSGAVIEEQAAEKINDDISPQDKNWMPKRRAAFVLPSYIAAGTYHIRLAVHDEYGKNDVTRDFPFRVGGRNLEPASSLTVQNFRFLRDEKDGPPLETPAYRAGSTVWARFDMTGFKTGPKNELHLKYGVTVSRPDGSVIFTQPEAADEKMELNYHPQFVPGVLSITTTPSLAKGEYTMTVSIHDLLGKQDQAANFKFRIE